MLLENLLTRNWSGAQEKIARRATVTILVFKITAELTLASEAIVDDGLRPQGGETFCFCCFRCLCHAVSRARPK